MRIGGCTFAFGPKPLEDACRSLKEFGFRIVDLGVCLGNTQVNPFDASENPGAIADRVNRCLGAWAWSQANVSFSILGNPSTTRMTS